MHADAGQAEDHGQRITCALYLSDNDVFSDPTCTLRAYGAGRTTLQFTMSMPQPAQRAERQTSFAVCDRAGTVRGGARRVRTDDLMLAKHALYQLSYGPLYLRRPAQRELSSICRPPARGSHKGSVVGPGRLELPTSRLSGVRSNQLSYRPLKRSAQTPGPTLGTWRLNARSHRLPDAAAVSAERETKTAASRTCTICVFRGPIGSVSILEAHP